MKTTLTVVLMGVALVVQAESYDATEDWSSVSSARYADGTGNLTQENGWTDAANVATVSNHVINVNDENFDGALLYQPSAPSKVESRQAVEVHFPSVIAASMPAALGDDAQAALAAVVEGPHTNWYGWCSLGWKKLTNTNANPPATGGCYVRVSFTNDAQSSTHKICYAVRTEQGNWIVLKPEGAEDGWLTNGKEGASGVQGVAFSGKTSLTDIKLTQTGTLTTDNTFEARKSSQGINDVNGIAANGNRNWENLVLGLSCSEPSSRPVVQPVQSSDASKVTLALGGVNVDTGTGSVKYRVRAYDDVSGDLGASDYDSPGSTVEMDLPSTGVRYYQIEVATKLSSSNQPGS